VVVGVGHNTEESIKIRVVCFKDKITEIKATTPKTLPWLSPYQDNLSSLETRHDKRMVPRQNLFILARRLQELLSQTQKLS
jgi:hypothetical protein